MSSSRYRYYVHPDGTHNGGCTRYKTEDEAIVAWRKAGKSNRKARIYDQHTYQWSMSWAQAVKTNNFHTAEPILFGTHESALRTEHEKPLKRQPKAKP